MPMDANDTALSHALHKRGGRVTPQRIVIARALRKLDRHATADEVTTAVEKELPNVSVPTVYSTLELLADLGLARRVTVAPGAVLYDPHTDDHHHLVCSRCHAVHDISTAIDTEPAVNAARRRGFAPAQAEVVITGLCANCRRATGD
jgi:Fur family peroxide stress response transcriptional regulator